MAGVHCQMTKIAHYFWVAQCVLLWAMALLTPLTYALGSPYFNITLKTMGFYVVLSWFFFPLIFRLPIFLPDCQMTKIAHYFWVALTPLTYRLKCAKGSMGFYVRTYPDFFFLYSLGMAIFCQQMAAPDFFCIFFTEIFLGKPNKYWGEMLYQGAMTECSFRKDSFWQQSK